MTKQNSPIQTEIKLRKFGRTGRKGYEAWKGQQNRAEAARLDLWSHMDAETANRINSERL